MRGENRVMVSKIDEIDKSTSQEVIHFRLQGRLGNQLFGLVNAHFLSKHYGMRVEIDLTGIGATDIDPEWLSFAQDWDWTLFHRNLRTVENHRILPMFNLGDNLPLPASPKGILFIGFIPSIEILEKSGLFQSGKFPFQELDFDILEPGTLAVCLRRGDYHSNPHLGILPKKYYSRALKKISKAVKIDKISVFTDDFEGSFKFLKKKKIRFDHIDNQTSALSALGTLSTATAVICANSTYSFWGAYFSKGFHTIPDPFYLYDKNWNQRLIRSTDIRVKFTYIPIIRYKLNLLWRRLGQVK